MQQQAGLGSADQKLDLLPYAQQDHPPSGGRQSKLLEKSGFMEEGIMSFSGKTWLMLSASMLMVPTVAAAQTQPGQTEPPRSDQTTTAAPGAAGTTASTTSPQGPSQVGQSQASQVPPEQAGLQEIIVTAQQRGENLQKAALPVAVVSGADLINSGVRGIESLGKLVPSVVVPGGSQGNLIFIRGVGNFSFTPNSDPAAAYIYDGIYVGRSSSSFGTFYDLERVEVLKGPQGTLYGRNATAGAINILPTQPHLGETSGYGSFSYGNYNAVTAEGAVNVGLGESAGLRVSGIFTRHDGYLHDDTQADHSDGVRAQLKVKLTPTLTVRIEGDYAALHGTNILSGTSYSASFAYNAAANQFVITPSGLPVSEGLFTAAAENYRTTVGLTSSILNRHLVQQTVRPFTDNDVYGIGYHIDWQSPIGTFSVVPAWRHGYKNNLSTDSAQTVGDTQDSNQYSVEARLVSNAGRLLDYIFGAYYFSEQIDDDTHTVAGVQGAFTLSRYTTHSPAFYGRLTLHATDWLRFTGGLRYTEDHKSFNSSAKVLAIACTVPAPAGCPTTPLLSYTTTLEQQPIFPAASGQRVPFAPGVLAVRTDTVGSGRLNTNKITYRGAVEIDVGPHSLVYGSIETGYRAGGFNTFFNYAPENITAYTIGTKNRFFDNRVQLNLELFDWEYRDQQLSYLGIDPTGRVGVLTQNIGRSRIRGAEVEGRALVTPTTTLSANVQYIDSKYLSFTYNTPSRPFTGCAVSGTTSFTVDCSGRTGINSSKWTVNFGAEQVVPFGDYQIVLDADTQYRSGRYVGFEYIAPEYVRPTWGSNASVSFGTKDGRYVLAAFVRNIENNRYSVYGTPAPATNLIVTLPNSPRTFGLRLSGKF